MYWNIKTSSTIFTACPPALTSRFESWTARNLVRFQIVTANLDPEVLQWPGGSLIAPLLWLCVMARSFWSVGTMARLHLRGNQAGSLGIARQSGRQTRQSLDQLISDHLRFTCHAISVLPGSTAMTFFVPGPGRSSQRNPRCLQPNGGCDHCRNDAPGVDRKPRSGGTQLSSPRGSPSPPAGYSSRENLEK
jgi:hypothetical protein